MKVAVFDLDGTVIDSRHRHASKPDGSIDLEHWLENNTPQKIAQDKLLPLVHTMRKFYKSRIVVICTARILSRADYKFFLDNNVPFHYVLSRPKGCMTEDGKLKVEQLARLLSRIKVPVNRVTMWDDNDKVIDAMNNFGVRCIDAKGKR